MPTDEFCQRMNYDVSPEFDRAAQCGCRGCIVDDQWKPVIVGDAGKLLDLDDIEFRITDSFRVDSLRLLIDRLAQAGLVFGIDKPNVYTQFRQSIMEKIISSAIERSRRYYFIACTGDCHDRQRLGCLPRRESQGGCASLERCQAFFEHILRR